MARALEQLLWEDGSDTEHDSDILAEVTDIVKKYGFGPREIHVQVNG